MAKETFEKYINDKNLNIDIIATDGNTHTAVDAANEHGVPVCNIVKSLLVKVNESDFALILVPGDVRLDFVKWTELLGADKVEMSKADDVKSITGYSIGGVPPFGHINTIPTYIEDGFSKDGELVAAAGSAFAVFKCSVKDLITWSNAKDPQDVY